MVLWAAEDNEDSLMKIAHISITFPPYMGGTGNVCFNLVKCLARLGHEAHVFTRMLEGASPAEMMDGFFIHRLRPLVAYGNAAFIPSLLNHLVGFDVIHLHYPFYGGDSAILDGRVRSIPLVITYHQDVLLKGMVGFCEKLLRFTLGKFVLRSAQRVLFTSLDYYQSSYARVLLRDREWTIGEFPNGVDVERFHPKKQGQGMKNRYKSSEAQFLVLLVAGLDRPHYFKGVDIFIQSLAQLPGDVSGIVVGDGEMRLEYEKLSVAYGMGERISFVGRVLDHELPDFYALADVTVLPSTTRGEAFGLVLIESMACGTPVIASKLPGVRTVVDAGEDGLLIQPNDPRDLAEKILVLKNDECLRQSMGEKGREKVAARYAWQKLVPDLIEIYEEVRKQK